MKSIVLTILCILIGYLFGSVPWGLVIGKVFYHKDIREYGSGNPGGTNAARVLGLPAGIAVIALDALKALIAMAITHLFHPGIEQYVGLAVCIGHCFPVFALCSASGRSTGCVRFWGKTLFPAGFPARIFF